MPRLTLNLLALLASFSVAPATASQGAESGGEDDSACPYERAELATSAVSSSGPTTITLTEPVPPESSLFSSTGGAGFLTP
jgi:hypothetical protein